MAEPTSLRGWKIAVIIPAFKAERHIAQVLDGIPDFVSLIVVVDDCSPDATADLVLERGVADPRIKLVRHCINQGVGGAMLTGYEAAKEYGADVVVKMDSDGQMDPAHLPALLRPILQGRADYAKGNRFLHSGQLHQMPLARRMGNFGLSFLTKLASGYWNLFDPTNGYTAIHGALIAHLDFAKIDRRYFFESSMLLELSSIRAVVRDVAMPARYGDETSHLRISSALGEFGVKLCAGLVRRLWRQYFLRDFSVPSVLMIGGAAQLAFGLVFGSYHWIMAGVRNVPTPIGTVMLAVLPTILGVQFLLHAMVADVEGVPTEPLHPQLHAGEQPLGFAKPAPMEAGRQRRAA